MKFQALKGLKFQGLEGLKFQNKQTSKQMTQTKIKIYLVKKLDSSHWMNFWVFIRFLMRLSMPSMLCVTNYNHKICSKTISYVQSKWNTNHHKRWQKKSEGAYAQHKRRTYNLKGPRAARTCLVTLKRGLLTIQLVGFRGAA